LQICHSHPRIAPNMQESCCPNRLLICKPPGISGFQDGAVRRAVESRHVDVSM
jgi:hypothetical protein